MLTKTQARNEALIVRYKAAYLKANGRGILITQPTRGWFELRNLDGSMPLRYRYAGLLKCCENLEERSAPFRQSIETL
jgi:hypothetical protein